MADQGLSTSLVVLVRDGTIAGPQGTEIDFRTPDYSVWLTIKADSDEAAEALASALESAFPEEADRVYDETMAEAGEAAAELERCAT